MALWLIPILPLASALLLMLTAGRLSRSMVALSGAGSVGLSAICVVLATSTFLASGKIQQIHY